MRPRINDRELANIREALLKAMRASGQLSYARKAPRPEAVSQLLQVITSLQRYLDVNPKCSEAWRLLSLAEEGLLNYGAAAATLRRAIQFSEATQKDKKRLERLKEYGLSWSNLSLTPAELNSLREFLLENRRSWEGNRDLQFTGQWLEAFAPMRRQEVIHLLEERGANSDFQVFHNVASS
jgi:hypothetical protein